MNQLPTIQIVPFSKPYQKQVEDLVLGIQNDEFKLGISAEEQGDLPDIAAFYATGHFWIALNDNNQVVGTIGLQPLDDATAVLRKMFLANSVRGNKNISLAQRLFDILLAKANERKFKEIWLDTPMIATAAHRFYERNGFELMPVSSIPPTFKLTGVKEIKIYRLVLS